MNDDNEKFTLKYAYEELWRCRDFELTHLWQRAVFLGAFLLAAFTGYGYLILQWCGQDRVFSVQYNLIGFAVAFVGLILSILWIMMAKGSKAWYERYEKAIYHFSELSDMSSETKDKLYDQGVANIVGFAYGNNSFKKYSAPVSSWIWNTKGGPYSPSKINIAIGHLAVLVWLIAICFHIAISRWGAGTTVIQNVLHFDSALTMLLLLVFGILFFWLYVNSFLKSEVLEEKQ